MAFKAGKDSHILMDGVAGSPINLTAYADSVSFPQPVDTHDVSVFGGSDKDFIPGLANGGEISISEDDHLFASPSLEVMQKLPPAFGKDGMVTAGNASGIVDGAAALIVVSPQKAAADGRQPLAEIVDWGIAGVDPSIMGYGPVPAIQKALQRTGLKLDDIDFFEINEAFAGQYLAVEKDLGLPGDAIASHRQDVRHCQCVHRRWAGDRPGHPQPTGVRHR